MSRRAGWVLLLGVALGAIAAAIAAAGNAGTCAGDPEPLCRSLVRTLSLRVGIVTAAFTILLTVTGMGLSRMASEEERRRRATGA